MKSYWWKLFCLHASINQTRKLYSSPENLVSPNFLNITSGNQNKKIFSVCFTSILSFHFFTRIIQKRIDETTGEKHELCIPVQMRKLLEEDKLLIIYGCNIHNKNYIYWLHKKKTRIATLSFVELIRKKSNLIFPIQAFVKEIGTAGAAPQSSSSFVTATIPQSSTGGGSIVNGLNGAVNGSISGSTVSSSSDGLVRPGTSTASPATTAPTSSGSSNTPTSGAGKESRKTKNLEKYVKFHNYLCYIISSDIVKVCGSGKSKT